MMAFQEEKCFPRGGKKPPRDTAKKSSGTLKRKRGTLPIIDDAELELTVTSGKNSKRKRLIELETVRDLSTKTLQKGMIVLGCVRAISDLDLKINLPGRIVGYVPATNISEEYSSYLKELLSGEDKEMLELNNMFKPGQIVVTKVEEVCTVDEKMKVTLTLNPSIIQSDLFSDDIVKGFMLSASVQSIEEHVYVMNCGIPGVRAFLRKSQASNFGEIWNDSRPLGLGQVLRCIVTKCTTADGYSDVELSADPVTVAKVQVKKSNVPLTSTVLGMCFQTSVAKICQSSLIVNITENQMGYIHSNYLNEDMGEITENSLLQGRVLYIEPLTKKIFLSALKDICSPFPPPTPFENIQKGTKFERAKVISSSGVVLLELEEDSGIYGYVTIHQMNKVNPSKIKDKYHEGSFRRCKVLDYDYMMQKYVCTLKRKVISQKYSCLDEIAPGVVTECTVGNVKPNGVYLKVDAIRGFVQSIHWSDVPVKNVDGLFQKGQKVSAKVLVVKNKLCEFTLKPTLVQSQNPILTAFSDAECGVEYDGVIVFINEKGVLIKFYGGFGTFVPSSKLLGCESGEIKSEELYYVGQVVKCLVRKILPEAEKLFLTVRPSETVKVENYDEEKFPLKVGKLYVVSIEDISPEGLLVREQGTGITGWIPLMQLTDCPQMAAMLCQSFKEGDELSTYCLSCADKVIFTLSPTFIKYFESSAGKNLVKKGLSELEVDMVLPSRVTKITPDEIIVSVPVQGEECIVKSKDIHNGTMKAVQSRAVQTHQTLMVRICRIFGKVIHGSCNLGSVCNRALMPENGLMLLQDYMNCQKRIHNFWKNAGHPLGELEVGSQVKGKVVAVTDLGAVVDLVNGARGVVMPIHSTGVNLEENMFVEGTVMFLDVVNQCVEISLLKHVQDMFSSRGKIPNIGQQSRCYVLISNSDVLVCGISGSKTYVPSKIHIGYVPSKWHVNDLCPSPCYPVGVNVPVVVRMCDGDLTFAVPREVELREKKIKSEEGEFVHLKNDTDSVESESTQTNNTNEFINNGNSTVEAKSMKHKKITDIKELLNGCTILTQGSEGNISATIGSSKESERHRKKKQNKFLKMKKKENKKMSLKNKKRK